MSTPGDYDYIGPKQPPPPPPADLEEQASAIRTAAEIAALALFVSAVMDDDEPGAADVAVIRSIFGDLIRGIAIAALMSAGPAPDRRRGELLSPVSTIVDDLVELLSRRHSPDIDALIKMVQTIRQSNRDAPPRDPGELSLARESARNFATWAYGRAIEAVATTIEPPPWLISSFGLKKTWITQHDGRVRPLHRRLHAKTVGWDKDFWRFPTTGQVLRYPGDPLAPLSATIGCRCMCWLSFSKKDELTPMIRDLPPLPE